MEVARIAVGLSCFGVAAYGFFAFSYVPEAPTLTGARLAPMGDALIFTADINNPSGPDWMTGLGSDAAVRSILTARRVALPGDGSASLAMDGVHGVLMGVRGDVSEGRLIPVTVWLEDAGRITTRARVVTAEPMQHTTRHEVPEGEPAPSVAIQVAEVDGGWRVTVETANFTMSEEAADGPHQPGVGHGHLYLNGLKLQRLYGTEARIGPLPSGTHEVRVTLNTNDHQLYSVGGVLVDDAAQIVVD